MEIKLLILDVDGTLTDGKIYMGEKGELFKAFDIKDGCGIHDILPRCRVDWSSYNRKHNETLCGIIPIIITARESQIVLNRCKELGIAHVYQRCKNKAEKLAEIAEIFECEQSADGIYPQIAYMGDDIVDIPIMKKCGIVAAPCDAVEEVLQLADYVAKKRGGNGAVREFIDYLPQVLEARC